MKNMVMSAAAIALLAGSALAERTYSVYDNTQIVDLNGNAVRLDGQRSPGSNEIFSVFTGLATSSNGLVLVESGTAPARDDLVNYDGVSEQINDYVNIAGTGALGQTRFVTESKVVSGGSSLLSISITSSGDLWPSGLAVGNPPTALTRGAIGIGLNLGALLGNDPLKWTPTGQPGSVVTAAELIFTDQDGVGAAVPLNPATFFGGAAGWSGIFGVVFNDTTSPTGVTGFNTTGIRLNLTISKIPAPGAAAVFGLAGLVAARRRRA